MLHILAIISLAAFCADVPGVPGGVASPEETAEVLVFLKAGSEPQAFSRHYGASIAHRLRSDTDAYVLRVASIQAANGLTQRLKRREDARVRAIYLNRRTHYVRMAFVPNDPYVHRDTPVAGFPGQWHLLNEFTAGLDARVQAAWNRDLTGLGVTIGVVDDCLEIAHPDLAPNYVSADSWDFGQNDPDPSPVYDNDRHGVATSGLAAAAGGNGIGVCGVAPYAALAGLRVDWPLQETQMFVDATLYHSSGSNTEIKVKNHSYGHATYFLTTPAEVEALATSAAAGTIHCFAAGNQRWDCGKMDLQHSPDSITVSGMGSDGTYANYTNYGACVFVTAPASSSRGYDITTTDRMTEAYGYNVSWQDDLPDSSYTTVFGGTSAATPIVSGVMALGKQVQPALNGRFAQHLLAMTCSVVHPGDSSSQGGGGWVTNAAGYHFNCNYGFGLINADAFTQTAAQYAGVSPLAIEDTGTVTVGTAIPDNSETGLSRTFTLSATTPLEQMLVTVAITHPRRGDLGIWLRSPAGTAGRLMDQDDRDMAADIAWTFTSNQFWGENPAGTWTLTVGDLVAGSTGTLDSFQAVARMGQLVSLPPPRHITGWRSLATHAGLGPVSIELDANGGGPTRPTVEPRTGGIQTIEIDFSGPVTLANAGGVSITGRTTSGGGLGDPVTYPPAAVSMITPATLQIMLSPGALPDATCYHIDIAPGTISEGLTGTSDCSVRALVGDTNGNGTVNLGDVLYARSQGGLSGSMAPQRDVDRSGVVDGADLLLIKAAVTSPAAQVLCP